MQNIETEKSKKQRTVYCPVLAYHQCMGGKIADFVVVFFTPFNNLFKVQMLTIFSQQQIKSGWNADGVQYSPCCSNDSVPPPSTYKTFDSIVGHQIIIVLNLFTLKHLKCGRGDAVVELQIK